MTISSIYISSSIPMEKSKSSPAAKPSTDEAVMNFSADSFSSLVKQAGQFPEVRSDVVDSFQARIQAGQYPSPDTMDSLTDVLGPSIVKMADASSQEG
jgi:hypothetical protein